jgi:hypothetical protein
MGRLALVIGVVALVSAVIVMRRAFGNSRYRWGRDTVSARDLLQQLTARRWERELPPWGPSAPFVANSIGEPVDDPVPELDGECSPPRGPDPVRPHESS